MGGSTRKNVVLDFTRAMYGVQYIQGNRIYNIYNSRLDKSRDWWGQVFLYERALSLKFVGK